MLKMHLNYKIETLNKRLAIMFVHNTTENDQSETKPTVDTVCRTERDCCICLDPMSNTHKLSTVVLPCGHELHEDCLYTYISHNMSNGSRTNKCPICKKLITINTQSYYDIKLVKKNEVSLYVVGVFLLIQLCQFFNFTTQIP